MNVQASAVSDAILIEKDVEVPMRDGARLMADVFRPKDGTRVPAILNLGPYQKDKLWVAPDTLAEKPNEWMNWETVNPLWWVPRGYAAVRVDGRGSGKSHGQCEPWSLAEAVDFYDAIEWAAAQPWCNGNVGLLGISYFAINQWFAANRQPPQTHCDKGSKQCQREYDVIEKDGSVERRKCESKHRGEAVIVGVERNAEEGRPRNTAYAGISVGQIDPVD